MNQVTTPQQRRLFYDLHQKEHTYAEIAQRFEVSLECVRYWCRRQRDGLGVESRYPSRPSQLLSRFDPLVRYVILRLRLEHPRWGPGRILTKLKKRDSLKGLSLPSVASIGRYLHHWPRLRRPPTQRQYGPRPEQPTRVHQRWQLDFKVGIALEDGNLVNLMTVWDPVGEACIGAFLFLAGKVGQTAKRVRLDDVWWGLEQCFERWGTLPEEIQTDGEPVLVSPRGAFPSLFTLRLVGLGIRHRVVHRPTWQAEVERGHRTVHEYAIVGNERLPYAELCTSLAQSVQELLEEQPSQAAGCAGRPPLQAHPELLQPLRPFQKEHLLANFALPRVAAYLADLQWQRIVNADGRVRLGWDEQRYAIGKQYRQQEVSIRYEAQSHVFIFSLNRKPEVEVKRIPAKKLDVETILGLQKNFIPQQLPLPLACFQGVSC